MPAGSIAEGDDTVLPCIDVPVVADGSVTEGAVVLVLGAEVDGIVAEPDILWAKEAEAAIIAIAATEYLYWLSDFIFVFS
ncbi:MAG: hypothetical protein V4695_01310 [Pseudomonadota bacterium]